MGDKKQGKYKAITADPTKDSWAAVFPGQHERVAVCASKGWPDEPRLTNTLYLTARQYYPRAKPGRRLSAAREVLAVAREVTGVQAALHREFDLGEDVDPAQVRFAKIHNNMDPMELDEEKLLGPGGISFDRWEALQQHNRHVNEAPLCIVQDSHIIFRVVGLDEEATNAQEPYAVAGLASFLQQYKPNGEGQNGGKPGRADCAAGKGEAGKPEKPKKKERGIVIRTEWDTSPVDEALKIATAPELAPLQGGAEQPATAVPTVDANVMENAPHAFGDDPLDNLTQYTWGSV